jgi:hypothetical protein
MTINLSNLNITDHIQTSDMANNYENVVEEFNKRNCKLIVTKEDYNEIIRKTKKNYKLNYIASCGHEHNVFYNVFKSRNTGIICPNCKNKEISKKIKEKINTNQSTKIHLIEQEFKFIKEFQTLLEKYFEIVKAFDGCNVDLIFKPKEINENKWVGIQVKTSNTIHLTYSFHINNSYKNCLILLFCIEDQNMWIIPENIIGYQKKISIGYNKSKYNIYKINKDELINKLHDFYVNTSKFEFCVLNTPTNIYQQREQQFKYLRQEIIRFIDFKYDEMEGTVYDFKINNFKVQEKVASVNKNNNSYIFQLCKNNGKLDGKRNQIQYDINDNEFYWLNCDNKQYFFVIPEKVLIEKGFIGNKEENKNRHFLKVTINHELYYRSKWLQPYLFNYETINEELNKIRLLNLLK